MSNPTNNLPLLLRLLPDNAMGALRRLRDRYETSAGSHHKTVYEAIAFIVAFVLHLEKVEADRREFLNDDYWRGKPHRPKEKNISRLATMYMIGAKESRGALYDQALTYAKVVDYYVGSDFYPEDIPADLKRETIHKLLDKVAKPGAAEGDEDPKDQHRESARVAAKETGDRKAVVSANAEDDDLLAGSANDDEVEESGGGTRSLPISGTENNGPPRQKRHRFNPDEELAIKAGGHFETVWNLEEGDTMWIQIRAIPPIGAWKQFALVALMKGEPF